MNFEKLQSEINYYLENIYKNSEIYKNKGGLQTSDAVFCAKDKARNKVFYKAIKKATNKNSKVVDAGSGTGILGFMSILCGAKECTFIEKNSFSLKLSKEIAKYLGIYDKCIFIYADAKDISLKEDYDLIISETIASGFVQEDFPFIINNLISKNTKIIPETFDFYIKGINSHTQKEIETKKVKVSSYDILKKKSIQIKPQTDIIEIETSSTLYDDIIIKSSECNSFINKRVFDLRNKHPFFEFVRY